jgi:hypothetical protein
VVVKKVLDMVGDAVRDKDAVAATLLICAAQAKAKGSTVYKIITIVCRTWIL